MYFKIVFDFKRSKENLYINLQVPKINFEKYGVNIPELLTEEENKTSDGYDLTVRGRVFDQSKPETFNQVNLFYIFNHNHHQTAAQKEP